MTAGAPEEGSLAESLALVLPALVRRLETDEAGRALLRSLVEDGRAPEELSRWLADTGSPTIATVVTGGVVDKIVNIAHADVVQLAPAPVVHRPAQLPADVPDFTDRVEAIGLMLGAVRAAEAAAAVPPVLAVSGVGGSGKSALGVHVGHLLREDHADAQLFVNLRGVEAASLDPGDVLDGFLRSLGVEGSRIPPAVDDRARLYRAALAGLRAVVLLDNARDEAQVRPLLPGGRHCAVIVTSRRSLPGLEGAVAVPLDVLEPEQGLELLTAVAGAARVAAEPEAAREVVALCESLPLAIRVVGAKLVAKPHWTVARLAERLRDERRRLGELSVGDLDVRGTFMLSYRGLEPELQRAFRLAGQVAGPDFPAWTLAALLDVDVDRAEELAEGLVEAQLFEVSREDATGELRYRLHDLLRVFALERGEETDSEAERRSAVERALGALLALAKRGLFLLSPHSRRDPVPTLAQLWPVPDDLAERLQRDPYDWFDAEYGALIAGIDQAHRERLFECTWELADSMHYYFRVRSLRKDWQRTHELALDAARQAGNPRGQAWTLRNLGNAHRDQYHVAEAAECFTESLEVFRTLRNRLGEAAALNNLGELAMDRGRLAEAVAYFDQCLPAWGEVGDKVGVAYVTNHLGVIARIQGRFAYADALFQRSTAMFDQLGDRFGAAHALRSVGDLRVDEGRHDDGAEVLQRSARAFEELGDRVSRAWALTSLARARFEQGDRAAARELVTQALDAFREFGDRRGETWALLVLGDAYRAGADLVAAAAACEEAVAAFASWEDALGQGMARLGLGRVHAARRDAAGATESLAAAARLFAAVGAAGAQATAERELLAARAGEPGAGS